MALITYADKSAMGTQPSIPEVNKITDSNMNQIKNAINNATTYSTTEHVVGTYIDDKPTYRVTKSVGNLPNNGRKQIDYTGIIPSGVICTNVFGIAERVSSNIYDYVNLESLTSLLMYRASSNTLYIDTTSDQSVWTGIVTIEYKKPTD